MKMRIVESEGIVIRSFSYRDTSLILESFTQKSGIVSFIVKGAKKRGNLVGLQTLSISMFRYKEKEEGLFPLYSYEVKFCVENLPRKFDEWNRLLCLVKIIRKVVPPYVKSDEIYMLLKYSILKGEKEGYPLWRYIWSLLHLLDKTGYRYYNRKHKDDVESILNEKEVEVKGEMVKDLKAFVFKHWEIKEDICL